MQNKNTPYVVNRLLLLTMMDHSRNSNTSCANIFESHLQFVFLSPGFFLSSVSSSMILNMFFHTNPMSSISSTANAQMCGYLRLHIQISYTVCLCIILRWYLGGGISSEFPTMIRLTSAGIGSSLWLPSLISQSTINEEDEVFASIISSNIATCISLGLLANSVFSNDRPFRFPRRLLSDRMRRMKSLSSSSKSWQIRKLERDLDTIID